MDLTPLLSLKTRRPQEKTKLVKTLTELTPDQQGDIDVSLIVENLRLSPLQRIQSACRAANDLEILRLALANSHA
ncbi:MAG TPA: hypothetical protein P5186_28175 [Candidatus Paceibacterota bacterium]|nr:hypothetical protein [Verrucomicrobiota bacterium]HRY51927.1 hypothetical protein [Candidatus Paceibacterota bacterium]HRZ99781.1 hypothetical protein [Candidatus Paceibacterota bacterium]